MDRIIKPGRVQMSYGSKPLPGNLKMRENAIGLTARDYEGSLSTLCAGCGHDSVTTAIVQAVHQLSIPPHELVKISGIGCSSKTPTYFTKEAHGFNSVHGRMPSVATGAYGVNGNLHYIGISGDGDSLSIGIGQFIHAARRNVNMLYILENNGVYGLTKGQFSASADIGSKTKKGQPNLYSPIDPVLLAISLGTGFVARAFSGDKDQLIPLIKAGMTYPGFAFIDVISPCVTFNDHEASTKSYLQTRENRYEVVHLDYVPPSEEITAAVVEGESKPIEMHDGSRILLNKVDDKYNPTDPIAAHGYIRSKQAEGAVVTGLLYLNEENEELHSMLGTVTEPLNQMDPDKLIPGKAVLENILRVYG